LTIIKNFSSAGVPVVALPSLRGCLIFIKCIKALLAAPTAFGTFLVAVRFSFSDEIAIFAWPF